jgi:hypothetical protein
MSLASPGSGNHLRLFKAIFSAPSGNSNTVGVELRDGTALRSLLYVPPGGVRELGLDGRYLQFDTSIRVTRADNDDTVATNLVYLEKADV